MGCSDVHLRILPLDVFTAYFLRHIETSINDALNEIGIDVSYCEANFYLTHAASITFFFLVAGFAAGTFRVSNRPSRFVMRASLASIMS